MMRPALAFALITTLLEGAHLVKDLVHEAATLCVAALVQALGRLPGCSGHIVPALRAGICLATKSTPTLGCCAIVATGLALVLACPWQVARLQRPYCSSPS